MCDSAFLYFARMTAAAPLRALHIRRCVARDFAVASRQELLSQRFVVLGHAKLRLCPTQISVSFPHSSPIFGNVLVQSIDTRLDRSIKIQYEIIRTQNWRRRDDHGWQAQTTHHRGKTQNPHPAHCFNRKHKIHTMGIAKK